MVEITVVGESGGKSTDKDNSLENTALLYIDALTTQIKYKEVDTILAPKAVAPPQASEAENSTINQLWDKICKAGNRKDKKKADFFNPHLRRVECKVAQASHQACKSVICRCNHAI